jgi:hypothetical protein
MNNLKNKTRTLILLLILLISLPGKHFVILWRRKKKEIHKVFDLFYKDINRKIENLTNDNEVLFVNAIKKYPTILQ